MKLNTVSPRHEEEWVVSSSDGDNGVLEIPKRMMDLSTSS